MRGVVLGEWGQFVVCVVDVVDTFYHHFLVRGAVGEGFMEKFPFFVAAFCHVGGSPVGAVSEATHF